MEKYYWYNLLETATGEVYSCLLIGSDYLGWWMIPRFLRTLMSKGVWMVCSEQAAVDKAERESQPRAYLLKGHAEFPFNCPFWGNLPPQQKAKP